MFGCCKNSPPLGGISLLGDKTKHRRKRTQKRKKPWGYLQSASAKVCFDDRKTVLINIGLF